MLEKNNEQHYLDVNHWNLDVTQLVKLCVVIQKLECLSFCINFILIPDTIVKITVERDESN